MWNQVGMEDAGTGKVFDLERRDCLSQAQPFILLLLFPCLLIPLNKHPLVGPICQF